MIKFLQKESKVWIIQRDEKEFLTLNLMSSTITNRFNILVSFIESLSKNLGNDFDEWFYNFFKSFSENEAERSNIVCENVPHIKKFVDKYFKEKNFDFSKFVDETKAKKSSILFSAIEIEKIIKLSSYLKIYSLISNEINLKLNQALHKKVYNELANEVSNSEIINKVFSVVKTKTFRYNLSDKYMWDYIKMIHCKSIDVHVIEIFNFIMNSILVLCEEERNPITYFVGVVDESIKWFLRSVYKGSVVYDDSISTEDIHGTNIDNLKTYCYNDTLGKLKKISYEQIYDYLESTSACLFDDRKEEVSGGIVTAFQNRMNGIKFVSPLCECLTFPILSKITGIPYEHFQTLSAEHAAILSLYVQNLFNRAFGGRYKQLSEMLSFYPENQPSLITTYKLKQVDDYVNLMNKVKDFFGFLTKIPLYKILNYFVGRISRINFVNTWSGEFLAGIPLSKIESEMIEFFSLLFSGKFEKELSQMKKMMESDF